jgi:hypothetical protein
MRAGWVLLLIAGGMCAWGQAEIRLAEYSGQYIENNHYAVYWYDPDPNNPSGPLQPDITINYDIDPVPFWFRCWNDVTGEPADIYRIGGDSESFNAVQIKVAAADGVSPGARNVGELLFNYDASVYAWFPAFNITGTPGTLGVESRIAGIMGPFSVVELGDPFRVDEAIGGGSALLITGDGPHDRDLTVRTGTVTYFLNRNR